MRSLVSVLFNEPKLLKCALAAATVVILACFSALQRAEIAEMVGVDFATQRRALRFSALQRAEIAEIVGALFARIGVGIEVSVLFNEPKLLKCPSASERRLRQRPFQCSSTSRNC